MFTLKELSSTSVKTNIFVQNWKQMPRSVVLIAYKHAIVNDNKVLVDKWHLSYHCC